MTLKISQSMLAPNLMDGISTTFNEPGTGATILDQNVSVRRARVNLSGFSISVLAANDYGGTKLLDLPDRNVMVLGVEADVTMVKGGVVSGLVATVDLDVGIGTAVASNQTLATTMIDVIEKADLDTDSLTVEFEAHTNDQSTATTPFKVVDSATTAYFLNVGVPAGITVDDAITCSGFVDIWYVDLGNASS